MKVLQIGYGRWGSILAKEIDADTNLDLVCIHTRTPIDSVLFCKDLDTALDNSLITAAIVSTSLTDRHVIIQKCLDAGKHVLTEKPLAVSTNIANSLLKTAQDHKLILYTNYTHSHSRLISMLIDMLSTQNINCIKITMTQSSQVYHDENVDTLLFSHILAILFNISPQQLLAVSKSFVIVHNKHRIILQAPSLRLEANIRSSNYKRVIEVQTDYQKIYVDFSNDGFISVRDNGVELPRKMINQSANLKYVFNAFKMACRFEAADNCEQAIAVQQALDRL
ncbi:Gfo/Idh/MocA family oxidoreductase [Paracoccaceae bacterium]|nr:Gfo/Idh/MocA family oxidoreductase [Paracoccaceae bacterium]